MNNRGTRPGTHRVRRGQFRQCPGESRKLGNVISPGKTVLERSIEDTRLSPIKSCEENGKRRKRRRRWRRGVKGKNGERCERVDDNERRGK